MTASPALPGTCIRGKCAAGRLALAPKAYSVAPSSLATNGGGLPARTGCKCRIFAVNLFGCGWMPRGEKLQSPADIFDVINRPLADRRQALRNVFPNKIFTSILSVLYGDRETAWPGVIVDQRKSP